MKPIIQIIFDKLNKKGVFNYMTDNQFISWCYFAYTNKQLNINNPKTFSEKIQWIKLYGNLEKYTQYVDKYDVRNYVCKTIGEKYLTPIIGVWEKFEEIPFDVLPEQFAIKATHGSGYNFICKNKSLLNKKALKKLILFWLKNNFYMQYREIQYKYCKPKIICERYLEDEYGELRDYKIFCFNGKPYIIEVDHSRFTGHKTDIFDIAWNKLPIEIGYPNSSKDIPAPNNLSEMLFIAKKLSHDFNFVRVDLYSIRGKIYFGELTFTPGSGLAIIKPLAAEYQLGNLIDISK